ncbi:hypothetical protein FZEAL_482 [Fusarium zealandicum]|uniref:gamma-glutamylcyclotransferase n=1 Tax=Fusarium zealandicum TaxID=1053134 RepID=A0A8H4XPP0_9HYPO|nr:hypothetical protein FZEAL_482 [Fusarium zealandicum]
MASPAVGAPAADAERPATKHYFAYGSNLHLEQMKRRCPGSKLIGSAALWDYRWHINERGYANVVEAQGRWVEGLVFEINARDEARLDVNEGVSKNAYQKCYLPVMLKRAEASLYRRPVSWIVNNGGPAQARHLPRPGGAQRRPLNHEPHWEQNVLVYISPQYIVDSSPKEEYINRINLGLVDAGVLGLADDYISNCIRPFIPAPPKKAQETGKATGAATATTSVTTPPKPKVVRKVPNPAKKEVQPVREAKQAAPRRTAGPFPTQTIAAPQAPAPRSASAPSRTPQQIRTQHSAPRVELNAPRRPMQVRSPERQRTHTRAPPLPPRPSEQTPQHYPGNSLHPNDSDRHRAASDVGVSPALPPRLHRRVRSIPVIVVQQGHNGYWYR